MGASPVLPSEHPALVEAWRVQGALSRGFSLLGDEDRLPGPRPGAHGDKVEQLNLNPTYPNPAFFVPDH